MRTKSDNFINKIKKHKIKIAIGSCLLASILVASTTVGVVFVKKNTNHQKNEYIYEPGKVRFDENGKIIIPIVKDQQNPSGIYQHPLPQIVSEGIEDNLKESISFNKILNQTFLNIKEAYLNWDELKKYNEPFNVSKEIKMLFDNLVPNNEFIIGQTTNLSECFGSLFDTAKNRENHTSLSTKQISNLCALAGINYAKEYDFIEQELAKTTSLYGGAGKPPRPNIPNGPDVEKPIVIDPTTVTIEQYNKQTLEQNAYYKKCFLITYSVVLPVLIAFNVLLSILNVFTLGSLTFLIAQTFIDIAFAGWQIAYTARDFKDTIELQKNINKLLEIGEKPTSPEAIAITPSTLMESILSYTSSMLTNWYPFSKHIIESMKEINNMISKNILSAIKVANFSISILSLAFSVTMVILEKNLIKNMLN